MEIRTLVIYSTIREIRYIVWRYNFSTGKLIQLVQPESSESETTSGSDDMVVTEVTTHDSNSTQTEEEMSVREPSDSAPP